MVDAPDEYRWPSYADNARGELNRPINGRTCKNGKQIRVSLWLYINQFYNRVRLHSGIDNQSPIDYEKRAT